MNLQRKRKKRERSFKGSEFVERSWIQKVSKVSFNNAQHFLETYSYFVYRKVKLSKEENTQIVYINWNTKQNPVGPTLDLCAECSGRQETSVRFNGPGRWPLSIQIRPSTWETSTRPDVHWRRVWVMTTSSCRRCPIAIKTRKTSLVHDSTTLERVGLDQWAIELRAAVWPDYM